MQKSNRTIKILKQWLAQWIEEPKFYKQEYLVFSRLMFKGANKSA